MGSHQKTEMPTDTHLLESKMGVRNDEGKTEIFAIYFFMVFKLNLCEIILEEENKLFLMPLLPSS